MKQKWRKRRKRWKRKKRGTQDKTWRVKRKKREQMKKKTEGERKKGGKHMERVEGGERRNIKGTEPNIDKPLMFRLRSLCHGVLFLYETQNKQVWRELVST